jgi:hypothetical protein
MIKNITLLFEQVHETCFLAVNISPAKTRINPRLPLFSAKKGAWILWF